MRILSFLILLVFLYFAKRQSSPHGADFKVSCGDCHSSKGWQIDKDIYSFDHNTTKLPLVGQHIEVNCRQCHSTLVFSEAKTECNECHTDVHQATTGLDCSRCHTPVSWLVNNITEIHQMSRFPLLGAHRTADCYDCHKSETMVRFDVPGVNCIDCHRAEYLSATNPNHITSGFSEECSSCHPVNAFNWTGAGFNHNFFPLSQGHSGINCSECHKTPNYSDANPDCYSCHQVDFTLNAKNPDHTALNFPVTCEVCHDLSPGWKPASYTQHDASFPIFSGTHNGTWNSCTECHPNSSNYSVFTCLSCHEHNKSDMDRQHDDENDYSYESSACLHCHPKGSEND